MSVACDQCGVEFAPRHPSQRYCSPRCRNQHWVEARPEARRAAIARYREANREKTREANRRYSRNAPARKLEITRSFRARNPEKARAHWSVSHATRGGKLVRPDACERCAIVGPVHAHHEDYSRPLEVQWLCPMCHKAVHAEREAA